MEAETRHDASLPGYEQKDKADFACCHFAVLFGQNDPVNSLVPGLKRVKDVNGAVKNPACQ